MSEKARVIPVGPRTISPASQQAQSTGWPQWMQDALAHEPQAKSVQEVSKADDPARGASGDVRILSRVSPPRR
jgi:hypothetical protein